jgi:nucleoside-diphosphate kinase
MTSLTEGLARGFYAVHRERPFYGDLVRFMTEGPVVMAVLEGPDAIPRYRDLMGATNPAKAAPGTIRADFGTGIERNAAHGSDGPETARVEIAYFFNAEIQGRSALPTGSHRSGPVGPRGKRGLAEGQYPGWRR